MATPILQIKNATKTFGGGFLDSTPPLVALDRFNLDIYESPARIAFAYGPQGKPRLAGVGEPPLIGATPAAGLDSARHF